MFGSVNEHSAYYNNMFEFINVFKIKIVKIYWNCWKTRLEIYIKTCVYCTEDIFGCELRKLRISSSMWNLAVTDIYTCLIISGDCWHWNIFPFSKPQGFYQQVAF